MLDALLFLAPILYGSVLGWAGALILGRPGGRRRLGIVLVLAAMTLAATLVICVFGVATGSRELIGAGLGLGANALFLCSLQRSNP